MAATPSPLIRHKRLGSELRALREQARLTCDEVGQRLDCSGTRISRIETGRIRARPGDVRELLEVYGVTGTDAERLVQLAREARHRGWWQAYGPVVPPWREPYLSLETDAANVRAFAPGGLPGLVQTEDYARSLPGATDRQLVLLRERQARLLRPGPPHLTLVLGEAALHGEVGGTAVLRDQLRHLLTLAGHPAVTLQVLPLRSAALVRAGGPFLLVEFGDPAVPAAVYLEYLTGGLVLDTADEVGRYVAAFTELHAEALGAAESAGLIRALVAE